MSLRSYCLDRRTTACSARKERELQYARRLDSDVHDTKHIQEMQPYLSSPNGVHSSLDTSKISRRARHEQAQPQSQLKIEAAPPQSRILAAAVVTYSSMLTASRKLTLQDHTKCFT